MNNKTKVLITDNSAEYGILLANKLRNLDVFAITCAKDGIAIL